MTTISKLVSLLHVGTAPDRGFENYYGALVRLSNQGVPSATEARRDYDRLRLTANGLVYF
jgi:hypothetical protein